MKGKSSETMPNFSQFRMLLGSCLPQPFRSALNFFWEANAKKVKLYFFMIILLHLVILLPRDPPTQMDRCSSSVGFFYYCLFFIHFVSCSLFLCMPWHPEIPPVSLCRALRLSIRRSLQPARRAGAPSNPWIG